MTTPFNITMITKAKGFTLIEVLVALLVLSIGLLGLAGLQVTGLRNNHSALLRSQGVILANDMADRMRANRIAVTTECYTDPNDTDCVDGKTLAITDLAEWDALLAQGLPLGTGSIACNDSPCTDSSIHAITVSWDDNRSGTADTNIQLSVRP